jgi:hypothetical protein
MLDHVVKQVMLLSYLFMILEMIDHLFYAMNAQVIESDSLRKRGPFEIEKSIGTGNFDPIPISVL